VGTPNMRPRSTVARRDSGNGDTPNSMPRVNVLPFHGLAVRLWFSSQIPIEGKSAPFQTQPNAIFVVGLQAVKNAFSPASFMT